MSLGEIFVILALGIILIGPEGIPGAIRTYMVWTNRLKKTISETKSELEGQLGIDEIRREIHNENTIKTLKHLDKGKVNVINYEKYVRNHVRQTKEFNEKETSKNNSDSSQEKDLLHTTEKPKISRDE